MADLARSIKGKMIVSVNDIPEMRKIFKGLPMKRLAIRYTVAGATPSKQTAELLITNFK